MAVKKPSTRPPHRPYKLSYEDHVRLRRCKAGGTKTVELCVMFNIGKDTVLEYLKRNPEQRYDAPRQ